MKKYIFIVILVIISAFLYGRYIEPHTLKINEYEISKENLPMAYDGLKIIHFSDLLYKETTTEKDITKLVNKINEQKSDVVIFTGDLINSNYPITDKEIENLTNALKKIDCTLYKYAIIGENDEKLLDTYKQILDAANFKILNNNKEYLFYKDSNPIKIIGLTDTSNIDEVLIDEEEITPIYTIALTHYPDNIEVLKDYNFDLILASHTTGGVINISFYGPLIKQDNAKIYKDTYYKLNDTTIYISNGIGSLGYTFRLFNKPSINLYRLKA